MKVSSSLFIVAIVAISAAGCSRESQPPTAGASLPTAASVASAAPATVNGPRQQVSNAGSVAPVDSSAAPIQRDGRVGDRFKDADVDHDNRLSRAEAKAMPFVTRRFEAIDTDHDGFVTRRELRTARDDMRAARAARAAANMASPVTQK